MSESNTIPLDPALIRKMYKLIYGNWATSVTYTFAELGLADHLNDGPKYANELGESTGAQPDILKRFLLCAASLELVSVSNGGRFELTPMGTLLRSDHPQSQRAAARLNGAPYRYHPWGHLVEILRQGPEERFSETMGTGTLDYLSKHPELKEVFHQAMTDLSVTDDQAIAQSYPFGNFDHIIDVGCGHGTLLKAILRSHSSPRGTMFDREDTFEQLTQKDYVPSELETEGRLDLVGGDFFQQVPSDGDLYILKNTIHNWQQPEAQKLMINMAAAMRSSNGNIENHREKKRLLIIEFLLTDQEGSEMANWLDLNFMILLNGRSRSLDEYVELAAGAGLKLIDVHPTPIGRKIVEFGLN